MDELDDYIKSLAQQNGSAQTKIRAAADRARKRGINIPDDVVNEFYDTAGHESGRSHFNANGSVKLGSLPRNGGQRAIGWSQIMPDTAKPYQAEGLDPYKEDDNIEMGLREFYKGDPSDSVARRLAYVGGPGNGALAEYRKSGQISDARMYPDTDSQETYRGYIERTGGLKGLDNYIKTRGAAVPTQPETSIDDYIKNVRSSLPAITPPATVPETDNTIAAQAKAAADPAARDRIAVLTTTPEQNGVFGNESGFIMLPSGDGRSLWVNKKKAAGLLKLKTPQAIEGYIKKHGFAKLVGKVEDVGTATTGAAVTTTAPDGTELNTSVVTTPAMAKKQIKADQRTHPGAESQVVPTDEVAQQRDLEARFKSWLAERNLTETPSAVAEFNDMLKTEHDTKAAADEKAYLDQNPGYADFLKYGGMKNSPESAAEYNRVMKGVQESVNADNAKVAGQTAAAPQLRRKTAPQQGEGYAITDPAELTKLQETPKGQPMVEVTPRDENGRRLGSTPDAMKLLSGASGTVVVNLKKKPAGMNAGRYQLGEALKALAPKYGFSNADIEKALDTWPQSKFSQAYNDLTDAQIAEAVQGGHSGLMNFTVTNFAINHVLNIKNGTKGIDPELSAEIDMSNAQIDKSPQVSAEPVRKGRDEVEQQAIDNVTTAIPGLNDKPFDEMVADEYARLQRTAIGADEQSGLQTAGEVIKGIFKTPGIGAATGDVGPEFAGGAVSGAIGGGGRAAELVSGAMKYSIPGLLNKAKSLLTGELDTTGEGVTKFAKKAEILAKHSKGEGVVADLGEFAGGAALDMPRIVGLTVLAGGNPVVAFGLDEALRSAGRGEGYIDQLKAAGHGAIMGAVFHGAGRFANWAGSKAANRFLTPEVVEALRNPENETRFAEALRNKGRAILDRVNQGSTEGEKTAAQNVLKKFLDRNGLTLGDLTSTEPIQSEIVQTAKRRAAIAKRFTERGTNMALVGSVGTGMGLAEGKDLKESLKQGGMWALLDLTMGALHKKKGDVWTEDDIARADGTVVRVPDEPPPGGGDGSGPQPPSGGAPRTRDLMLVASEDGQSLNAVDVTGVPIAAVDAAVLPKAEAVRVVYDKDGTQFTVKEDRGKTLLLEGEKGNVVLRPARQFTDAVPGGDQAPTDGLGDAPRTVSHPDPAIDGQAVIAETGDGRVVVANPNNKGGVSVVTDRGDGLGDAPRLRGVETNEAGETTFAGETENQIEERRQFERDTAQITPQQVRNLATDKQVPLTEFEADHLDNMSPDNLRTVTRRILGVSNDGLGDAPRGELVNGEPDEALRSVVGDKLKSLDRAIFPRIVTNEQGDRLRVPEAMLDEYDAMAKRGAAPEEWHALAKRVPAETQTQADDEILFSATDPAGPTMTKEAIVAQIAATHPGADIETTKAIMPDGDYHAIEVPLSAIWQVYGKAGQEKVHDYASRKTQAPAIVVNDMHEVVDGKHRFRAAQLRGDKTIRVWAPVGVTLKSVAAADDAMPWAVVDEKPINAKIADLVLDPDGIATARARYVHDPNYRHTNTEPVAVERQADGKLHVLDGYHRIEQARRDGQAAVVVKVVREAAPVVESTDGQATTSTEERGLSDPSRVRGSSGVLADPYGPNKGDDLANKPEPLRVPGYKNRIDFGGFKPAQDAARAYAAEAGLDYQPQTEYVALDKERAARIADEFDKLVHDPQNPEVARAYKAMLDETMAQYRHILDTGLKIEFIDYEKQGDPYARSPRLAILDVVENNHLWVFSTRDGFGSDETFDASDNPLLGETEFEISGRKALANDIFRVVHDYFGHIKDGVGFRARGEENAWASHSRMYSPLARRAMTTETRGQNSYVNFGPWAEYNKTASAADTHYADQKIGLLPEWVSRLDSENDLSSTRPGLYQDRTGSTVESTETMDGVTDRQSSTAGVSSALSGGRNARGASTSEAIPQPSSSGGMVSPDTDTAASLGQGDRRRAESGAGPPEGTVERRNDLADTATRRRSGIRDRRQKPGTQAQVFGQNDLAGLERVERRSDAVDRRQADVGSAAADSLKNVTEPPSRSSVDLLSDPPRAKKLLGLGKVATVREIGEALDKYTIEHGGKIEKTDRSETARNAIARGLSDEAKYQIEASSDSGLGWYSENYPRALEALANVYPEFKTNPAMKDVFTAVLAVTSNGERVEQNMANATKVYDAIRKGGKPSQIELGTKRQGAFATNMRALEDLLSQVGPAGLRDALLRTTTVGEINKQLKAKGITPATAYPADASMPMSVLHFGPKLGAFAANLMGSEGYLTMDLWWTRSFNRHRGILTPQPTQGAINSLRSFLDPKMTDDDVIQATPELAGLYASKERNYHTELELKLGRKEGTNNADKAEFWAKAKSEIGPRILKRLTIEHRAEKLANTIYKDAFKELNEAPFNSGDRAFMIDTAVATQKLLKAGGLDLSVADIQAALWYYEKRLYASLGKIEKASKGGISDLGYEEAIRDAADSYRPRGSTSWLDRQPQSHTEVGADQGPDETDDILRNVATAAPPSAQRLEHDLASARREYDNYKRFFEKHQPGSVFGGQTTLPDAAAVEAKLATFKKAYDDAQAAWNEFQRSRPKAPNGKPSNLSPEHHALVRTPEFKEYFGDWEKWAVDGKTVWDAPPGEVSVVVDQNGEPLVVYHGTTKAGFIVFAAERGQKVKGAIFFTTRRNNAATYSGTLDEANVGLPDDADVAAWWNDEGGANEETPFADLSPHEQQIARDEYADATEGDDATRGIYSAFLNIRDPYETHFEGAYWNGARDHQYVVETDDGEVLYDPETGKGYFNDRLDAIAVKAHYEETGQYTRDEMHVQEAPEHDETTDSAAREGLNSSDGTIIRDVVDPGPLFEGYSDEADLFIVHDARQIKSVHNQGTFNADDPNILKSVRPADADDQIAYWNDAHTEDVLTGTTGGVIHDNGEWEISLADAQLFNRILKQYRTKQLGRPVVEHSFDGITLSTDMLTKLADHAVSDTRPALVKLGYTNDQLQGLDALVKQMRAMVKRGKSHGLAYVYEDVLPEERVHLEDFQAGRTSAAAMAKLMQHAIWQTPGRKFTREYGHQSDSAKASEFAAKLATNQAAKYGWDKLDDFDNLKKEFLRIWADGIIDKNRARIEEDGWEQFAKDFPTIAEYAKDPTPDTTGNAEASGEPGPVQGDRGTGQETGPPETAEEAPQQERDQGRSDGSTTPPERGLSRVGASIEAQAVAAKLAESFQGTAEYDSITVEDQAARATELVDTDLPRVRKILRGSEQLPTGLRAASIIAAVENYARDTGDADLLRDLAKSKLVSETSLHAQELRMLRERDPWGPGKLVQEIQSILDQKPKPTSSLTADPEADLAAAQAELDQKLADLDAEIERRATEMAETNAQAELDRILGEPRPSQYVIDLAKAAVKKIDDGAEAARKRLKERFGTAPAKSVAATDEILKSATDPLQPHPVTDTEEFRQWFGDSKVVDDIGEPLIVYHGQTVENREISVFRPGGWPHAIWLSEPQLAGAFAGGTGERMLRGESGPIYPLYARIVKPLEIDADGSSWHSITPPSEIMRPGYTPTMSTDALAEVAKRQGYDGLIVRNVFEGQMLEGDEPTTIYAVFKSSQLKSAIGNQGTFDPQSPDILKSVSDDDIKDFAKVGASYLAKMDIDRDGFRDAMVAEFGPEIEPDIDEIYTEAKNVVQRATGKKVASAKKSATKGTIRDRIAAAIQKDQTADVTALVQQLARGHVEKGVSDRDALLNAVHKDLEDIVPDITRREAMDMISGYGKYRQLSKDATAAILRDLKGQMQQIAKLEDMAAGEAPKKTGAERRKASDEERRLIQQVEDAKKKGGYNVTDPATQLRTALAAAKTRLKNQIKDLDDQIRTRRKILKTKTRLEYDAEANDLKRQRDELKKTFDEVFGPTPRTPMTDAQRLEAWKKRASRRMEELKTKLDAGDYAPTPKRPPVELDAAAKAVKADLDRIQARIEMLRGINGEVPKEVVEEVNRLANDIELTREAYAADPTDENRMAWGYAQEDLRQYVAKIKNEANRWTLEEIKKHPIAAAKAGLTGIAGNSKAIRAALDDSAVFRQGWKTLLTHPGIWAQNAYKSFYHAIKVWGVESVMRELNADLLSRPNAERYRKAKLAVVGPYEEEFPEAWIEKVPIAGRPFKSSQNAYTAFVQKTRADVFDYYLSLAEKAGLDINDPEILQPIGRLVNSLTGRGDLGDYNPGAFTNNVFFSLRFLKSHIDVLGGQAITGAVKRGKAHEPKTEADREARDAAARFVRKRAILNLVKILVAQGVILATAQAIAKAFGVDDAVEWDPRSSDFGKIKIGNTRFDVSGGSSSFITVAARLATGSTKTGGKITPLEGGWGKNTRLKVLTDFILDKLAPLPATVRDWLDGENFDHEKPTAATTIRDLTEPMPSSNFREIHKDPFGEKHPGFQAVVSAADFFGIGTNTYTIQKKKSRRSN